MDCKLNLTKTAIEGLHPEPGKQVIYWDAKIPGLGLRVSPGGAKTFFVQSRIKGRVRKVTIGPAAFVAPEKARKLAMDYLSKMATGVDPAPPRDKTAKASSLGDLLTGYVALLERQGKYSARAVGNAFKLHVEAAFPRLWKKPANEITLDDCMAIVGRVNDAGKAREADRLRSNLRTAFSRAINARGDTSMPKAMRELRVTANPVRDLQKVAGSTQAKDRALSLAEFRAYWRRIQALPEPKRSLAMLHILTGGQRQRQLARVKLTDIDRDAKSMTLMDSKGRRKAPRAHVVPLLPEALAAIDRITGSGEYVFSSDGGAMPIGSDYLIDTAKAVCAAMQAAGELEGAPFTAGVIRATVETRLIAKPYRVSSDVLAQLLSHGLGGVQQRHYQKHDFFDEKLDALHALKNLLEGDPVVIEFRARA